MKPPHWDRVQEIYHAALALPRSERAAFVANACAGDPELTAQINSLLKAADSPGVLDIPVTTLGSAPDNLVGTTIAERYFVEKELEHGGMSQVYFGHDLRLQRQAVVIKILSQALVQNADARQKFAKEVTALLRIEHPGVVRVQDTGDLPDGRPYIVMQYVDGETLRSQITSEGMDLERVASIVKQIGAALDHVHEKGIFHRDLKPENIMLRRGTDTLVLIDFGIAKIRDSLIAATTADGLLAGTLRYMSPEQLRGEKVTAASDIYSMGIVAYEMVTGRRPFNPTSASQLLEMQRVGVRVRPMRLRQDLPVKADRIITRALKFEPTARYERAGEFGDRLAGALLETSKPSRRQVPRWAIAIGGFVILAVLSFGLFKYVTRTGDTRPTRSFKYWLTVQKMRDGKEYQEPFQSHGEETFERGDKFRLTVASTEPGYLYVFNEGPTENDTSFRMIYPNQATNAGSATIGANQSVQSDWITFRGPAGNENFWIVWSVSPITELDASKAQAFNHPRGGLTGESLIAVKEFLRRKLLEEKVTVFNFNANQTAVARGKSDLLITLAEFKHR
jgi:serine/threonine protein kinase